MTFSVIEGLCYLLSNCNYVKWPGLHVKIVLSWNVEEPETNNSPLKIRQLLPFEGTISCRRRSIEGGHDSTVVSAMLYLSAMGMYRIVDVLLLCVCISLAIASFSR